MLPLFSLSHNVLSRNNTNCIRDIAIKHHELVTKDECNAMNKQLMTKMTESLYSHGNDWEKSRKEKR